MTPSTRQSDLEMNVLFNQTLWEILGINMTRHTAVAGERVEPTLRHTHHGYHRKRN
jgi:hypothetical protein